MVSRDKICPRPAEPVVLGRDKDFVPVCNPPITSDFKASLAFGIKCSDAVR